MSKVLEMSWRENQYFFNPKNIGGSVLGVLGDKV